MRRHTNARVPEVPAQEPSKGEYRLHIDSLHAESDKLQKLYGSPGLNAIYGAGCTIRPRVMFVFMNPTARNVSAQLTWNGIRAPWLGTRIVWRLFQQLDLLTPELFQLTQHLAPAEWSPDFAQSLYTHLARQRVYITNLAKCTLNDSRPLPNAVFKRYVALLHTEVDSTIPEVIVTFGNQVSSVLLGRPVSVAASSDALHHFHTKRVMTKVIPTYYPVGQGVRNMPLAVARLRPLLAT